MIDKGYKKLIFSVALSIFTPLTTFQSLAETAPPNSLVVNESGNVGVGIDEPTSSLHIQRTDGTANLLVEDIGTGGAQQLIELRNPDGWPFQRYTSAYGLWDFYGSSTFGINNPNNPGLEFNLTKTGSLTIAGVLSESSSRTVKQNIVPIDSQQALDKLVSININEWTYTNDENNTRHVGPMAEDFYDAFGLGKGSKVLSTIDTSGVTIAALQGLKAEKDREIVALKDDAKAREKDIQVLIKMNADLVKRIELLEKNINSKTNLLSSATQTK